MTQHWLDLLNFRLTPSIKNKSDKEKLNEFLNSCSIFIIGTKLKVNLKNKEEEKNRIKETIKLFEEMKNEYKDKLPIKQIYFTSSEENYGVNKLKKEIIKESEELLNNSNLSIIPRSYKIVLENSIKSISNKLNNNNENKYLNIFKEIDSIPKIQGLKEEVISRAFNYLQNIGDIVIGPDKKIICTEPIELSKIMSKFINSENHRESMFSSSSSSIEDIEMRRSVSSGILNKKQVKKFLKLMKMKTMKIDLNF